MTTKRSKNSKSITTLGSAKRLTQAIGGTKQLEPNMVTRYNFG